MGLLACCRVYRGLVSLFGVSDGVYTRSVMEVVQGRPQALAFIRLFKSSIVKFICFLQNIWDTLDLRNPPAADWQPTWSHLSALGEKILAIKEDSPIHPFLMMHDAEGWIQLASIHPSIHFLYPLVELKFKYFCASSCRLIWWEI